MHISIIAIVTRMYSMTFGFNVLADCVYCTVYYRRLQAATALFLIRLLVIFNDTILWGSGKAHNTKLFVFFTAVIKHRFTSN
jgi:hypothetical protein